MKNTLLFQNKTELDAAVSEIPFETKAIAYESDTDTHWFSSYIDKSAIVYNTVDLGLPSGLPLNRLERMRGKRSFPHPTLTINSELRVISLSTTVQTVRLSWIQRTMQRMS